MEKIDIDFLSEFELWIRKVPGNGDCFFHSILNAYSKSYISGEVDRILCARRMRKDISEFLDKSVGQSNVYEYLSGGNLRSFGAEDPVFTLKGFKKHINSNRFVGTEVYEVTSLYINKNVFVINLDDRDVQIYGRLEDWYNKDITTVVLFYKSVETGDNGVGFDRGGHYDTCGITHKDGTIATHFLNSHKFIRAIIDRYNYRVEHKI